jgi:hypothetical protein
MQLVCDSLEEEFESLFKSRWAQRQGSRAGLFFLTLERGCAGTLIDLSNLR